MAFIANSLEVERRKLSLCALLFGASLRYGFRADFDSIESHHQSCARPAILTGRIFSSHEVSQVC